MNDKDIRLREIIRVDHAGEYGAQQIYSGQIKFTKDTKFKSLLENLADEEKEHFEYFEKYCFFSSEAYNFFFFLHFHCLLIFLVTRRARWPHLNSKNNTVKNKIYKMRSATNR